ncbi:winged helix DNA-binding domain-containing protein [Candidatus Desantisbacteria bacterium]|nr:winged helix DNA-binding domain-containing protein [Candidatus Desantisbacteria bacterium]
MFKIEFPQELINEYVSAKQHLKTDYKSNNIEEMIDNVVGLSASYSHTAYFSTIARINFSITETCFNKIIQSKKIIKKKNFNGKLFFVSKSLADILNLIFNKKLKEEKIISAKTKLVASYMYAFGPVSLEDIIWWTGFNKEDTERTLFYLEKEIIAVNIDNITMNYYMLKTDYEQMINWRPEKKLEISFLPAQDNYITGYNNCDRFLRNKNDFSKIFSRGKKSKPVVLINGKIFGTWEIKNGKIKTKLFNNVPQNLSLILNTEKERIDNIHNLDSK